MSNKNERQLFITAYSKQGKEHKTFGGLPYPVPIINPIWVGMDKIIAAKAMGLVDIYVHNVEPPVLLTDELYNKFIDLGYIDETVVAGSEVKAEEEKVEEKEKVSKEAKEEKVATEETQEKEEEEASEEAEEIISKKKGKKNKSAGA